MLKRIFLIAAISLTGFRAFSQPAELEFTYITTDHGLSYEIVNAIHKDTQGFIWFGTGDGLNRYDGSSFTIFKEDMLNKGSFKGNFVRDILESPDGIIWIGTNRGLNRYDPITDQMESYELSIPNDQGLAVFKLVTDSYGDLWIGGDMGLGHLNSSNGEFTLYNEANIKDLFFREISAIQPKNDSSLWIGTESSLYLLNTATQRAKLLSQELGELQIHEMLLDDRKENLWLATRQGLIRYNIHTGIFKRYEVTDLPHGVSNAHILDLFIDGDGQLWFGTDGGGLHTYLADTDTFYKYRYSKDDPRGLNTDIINSIYIEDDKSIWVGTIGFGVNHYSPYRFKFLHEQNIPGNDNSLSDNRITEIHPSRSGGLWIGTDGAGYNYYDPQKHQYRRFYHDEDNLNTISNNFVIEILEDSRNNLWLSTYLGGVNRYDLGTGRFDVLNIDARRNVEGDGLASNQVWAIHEDRQGILWFGTSFPATLTRYDPVKKDFKRYGWANPQDPNSFEGAYVFDIEEGPEGNLWIGTDKNLYKFNQDNQQFTRFESNDNEPGSLSNYFIKELYFSSDGTLWVGTFNGLNQMDPETGEFIVYHQKDGLPNDAINAIMEDDKGKLWITTNNGLAQFDPEGRTFKNFYAKDGLQSKSFKARSIAKTADGMLYFGGLQGFNAVSPSSILNDITVPKTVLTRFLLFNKEVFANGEGSPLKKAINYEKEIILNHNQSIFSIEYAAIDYMAAESVKYSYRLVGLEENWNNVSNRRTATYTHLKPGPYTFQVKAANHDGIWNEIPTEISIVVLPPWWMTWWARTIFATLILFLLYVTYRLRFNFLEQQKDKLKKQVQDQTKKLEDYNIELMEVNGELTSTNHQLKQKSEELEITLGKLKETQSQLIESEKLASIGTLSAGVAHEINNPLNFIKGGVTNLASYLKKKMNISDKGVDEFIWVIDEGVKRATGIVKSLNQFGRKEMDMDEDCEIHPILDNCLLILNNNLNQKVEVTKSYSEEDLRIHGNDGMLCQSFLNVITNAQQAIEEKGTITIETKRSGDQVVISISDNGVGMDNKIINKIMDPFFTTKDPAVGTGLGLAITYQIIKKHGGHIKVESEPGKGSTFDIYLPMSNT